MNINHAILEVLYLLVIIFSFKRRKKFQSKRLLFKLLTLRRDKRFMNAIIKLGENVDLKYGRRKRSALEIGSNIKNEKGYKFEKYLFI